MITREVLEHVFKSYKVIFDTELLDRAYNFLCKNKLSWAENDDFTSIEKYNDDSNLKNSVNDRWHLNLFAESWLYHGKLSEYQKKWAALHFDDTFLNTLADAGRAYGWNGDYNEVVDFIKWCFELVGKEAHDLTPLEIDHI